MIVFSHHEGAQYPTSEEHIFFEKTLESVLLLFSHLGRPLWVLNHVDEMHHTVVADEVVVSQVQNRKAWIPEQLNGRNKC